VDLETLAGSFVERGWRLYLTVDEDEPGEAVIYCSICAEREFGEPENAGPL
jgi:hypothetical protein